METKEKDKKYSIILGIMILLFLIVVGIAIAWGLGYIHFGKASQEALPNNEEVNIYSEEANKQNGETIFENDEITTNAKLKKAYEKYKDVKWGRDTFIDASVWGEKAYIDESTGKVIVQTIDYKTGNVKKTRTINEITEKPKYIKATYSCAGYEKLAVLTVNGNVYIQDVDFENIYSCDNRFIKLDIGEKVVEVTTLSEFRLTSCSNVDFYFLTESGKLVNVDGETYEERNEIYADAFGNIDFSIYVYKDNTIGYISFDECNKYSCKETRKKFKYEGKDIVAKNVFLSWRNVNPIYEDFDIIGHSPTYTAYIVTKEGELLYIYDYEMQSVKLHSTNVKNIEKFSDNSVKVNYLDGSSKIFNNANIEM